MKKHLIVNVVEDSPAYDAGIRKNEYLLLLNGNEIEDIFDYHYIAEDREVDLTIESEDGSKKQYHIVKDEDTDLGLLFAESLMDDYKSCYNKCVFCFIDQNAPNMRETIYFKDDDSRLSFLQGNYITMTNMKEKEIDRIIKYKLAPINISVHTTNPELRCEMLHNRFAGNVLSYIDKLYEAEIPMNAQVVLCKGLNDGDELRRTISDLMKYMPVMRSLSIVPVGLTKFREGLYPLELFDKADCNEVIDIIEGYAEEAYKEHGIYFVHASDEFYIVAGREMPKEETYDGYNQIENGVGMTRLLYEEYTQAVQDIIDFREEKKGLFGLFKGFNEEGKRFKRLLSINKNRRVSMICGMLSKDNQIFMKEWLKKIRPDIEFNVFPIVNDFFGHKITVTGLLTGQDIIAQLKGKDLGDALLIPSSCLKADEDIFLDDISLADVQKALQVETVIVKSDGDSILESIIGL